MNRYQFENLISDYLDGELSFSKRKEFESYLEENEDSKLLFIRVKKTLNHMKNAEKISTADNFNSKLLSKIKERSNHAERQLRRAHSRLKENKKEISKIEKQLESSITTIITTTPRSKSSKLNRLKSQLKLSRRKISKNFSLYHKGMRELFLLQRDLERLSKEVEKY